MDCPYLSWALGAAAVLVGISALYNFLVKWRVTRRTMGLLDRWERRTVQKEEQDARNAH